MRLPVTRRTIDPPEISSPIMARPGQWESNMSAEARLPREPAIIKPPPTARPPIAFLAFAPQPVQTLGFHTNQAEVIALLHNGHRPAVSPCQVMPRHPLRRIARAASCLACSLPSQRPLQFS